LQNFFSYGSGDAVYIISVCIWPVWRKEKRVNPPLSSFYKGGMKREIWRKMSTLQKGVVVVMPAYNAEKTLEKTVNEIPAGAVDEIILVDDSSRDKTVDTAKRLGLRVYHHEKNKGYGGNQKTCYNLALETGADYIIMVHPDYQYDARVIPHAVGLLQLGICDIIIGNRIRTRKESLSCGMPFYKYIANRFLTAIENFVTGQNLGEWHSGFRAYSRKVLETIPYKNNSDDFVFDTEFLVQAVASGFKIGDIPIPVRYFKEASSINFSRSVRYGVDSLGVLLKYIVFLTGIRKPDIFRSIYEKQ
jgi:glycosyltransferase involved in cell wall biosynthesis